MAKKFINERKRIKGVKYPHKKRSDGPRDNYERKKSFKQKKNRNPEERDDSTVKWQPTTKELPILRADAPNTLKIDKKMWNVFFCDKLTSYCCHKLGMPDKWSNYLLHSKIPLLYNTELDCAEIPPTPEPVQEQGETVVEFATRERRWLQADKKRIDRNYDFAEKVQQHKVSLYHLIVGNTHPDYIELFDLTPEGIEIKESHDPWELIKAMLKNNVDTIVSNYSQQYADDTKAYLRTSQYPTELIGRYHSRYIPVYDAYYRSYSQAYNNQVHVWCSTRREELHINDRVLTTKGLAKIAEKHEDFKAIAITAMSKFESCKHFVKGLYSHGMDTIETAIAAETQILFDGGAMSPAMEKYKAQCDPGKDPFHPSTVYTYVNNTIIERTKNPTIEDKMRANFVPKRTLTSFNNSLEKARGVFVTQVKGEKPNGKGEKSKDKGGEKSENKSDAKTSEKDKREGNERGDRRYAGERKSGRNSAGSSRSNRDDDSRSSPNLTGRTRVTSDDDGGGKRGSREYSGTRSAGRDRSASRERGDSRDRGNRGNGYDRENGYNNYTQRRRNDDRDEGSALKRARLDDRGNRGRSPNRNVGQGRGQNNRDACKGCGEEGHWWRQGVCAEGRALLADKWNGYGKPPLRDKRSNSRNYKRERSESEDSDQSC